jgi:hypothetical protein
LGNLSLRRDVFAALAIIAIISVEWAAEYGFFEGQRLIDPISYFGDAHVTAAIVAAARRLDFLPLVPKTIPSLGAPFIAQWDDFPINEDILYFVVGLLARLLGVFGAINLAFLVACNLAGLTFYWTCRRLRLGRPGAVAASLLYGLSMFVFARSTHHFSLIFYYFIPPLTLVGVWLTSRKGIPLRSARFAAAAVIVALASTSMIYFVFFSAQLFALVCIVRIARWGRTQWKTMLALSLVAVACVLSMQADTLIRLVRDGRNVQAVSRAPTDVEHFALKPIGFFTAGGNHRYGFGQAIAITASKQTITSGEAPAPYMGVVGGISFLAMVGFLIVRLARGQLGLQVSWALFALWFLAMHVVGGVNSVFGLFGVSAFRSVNRASIFVFTFVLFFFSWAFGRFTRRLPSPVRWAFALIVGSWGAWEAIPTSGIPATIAPMRRMAESDRQLVAEAERVLGPGSKVFCLPAMDFPEGGSVGGVDVYEMFRPYFFSDHLVFSHGDMKGRPNAAWKVRVSQLPADAMLRELKANGFAAMYVNLKPYGGTQGLAPLLNAGASVLALAPLQDSAFLKLPP